MRNKPLFGHTVSSFLDLQFWCRGSISLPPHTVIDLIPSIEILILWVGIGTNDQVGRLLLSGSVGFVNVLGSIFFFLYISCSIFWSFSSSPNSYLPSGFFPLTYLPNFMFFVFFFSPKQQQQKQTNKKKTQNTHTRKRDKDQNKQAKPP